MSLAALAMSAPAPQVAQSRIKFFYKTFIITSKVVLPYAAGYAAYPYAAAPVIAYAPLGNRITYTSLILLIDKI